MEKQVILLNGPSSSGKSTLAAALKALIEKERGESYHIVSIDDFMKLRTDETIYEDDVFEISHEMCAAVLKALETLPGVVIDHVITSERIYLQLLEALAGQRLRTVRVVCPLEVLKAREEARGNRCPGSAEASAQYLYPVEGYDMTVDTHAMTTAECASKIFGFCFPAVSGSEPCDTGERTKLSLE